MNSYAAETRRYIDDFYYQRGLDGYYTADYSSDWDGDGHHVPSAEIRDRQREYREWLFRNRINRRS